MEKYLVKVTLFDRNEYNEYNEYYVCKGAFTKYTLDSNVLKGIHFDLEEAKVVEQELKKEYPEFRIQLNKTDCEEENFWQWDTAWDIERAANNLFDFLNYKIKYFPDEIFYEWYVYTDCKCRCLLVEQKEEGSSKAFYHVYENDIVSVTKEKNYRKITIYSKDETIETMFGE